MEDKKLTENELEFCELYVNGGFGVAGDHNECYKDVFGSEDKKAARKLIARQDIKDHVKSLIEDFKNNEEHRALAIKIQVTDTLQKVMRETSTDVYRTPKGHALSPAPLRSVSVNAAKALADMYVDKPSVSQKLQLESDGKGGIVFNVIVPKTNVDDEDNSKED